MKNIYLLLLIVTWGRVNGKPHEAPERRADGA